MKWPHASLTDQQVRDTYFIPPEIYGVYELALGEVGCQQFINQRKLARASGGDLLLIGWPDGTTITLLKLDASQAIDVETLVETYRANAAMYRITNSGSSK